MSVTFSILMNGYLIAGQLRKILSKTDPPSFRSLRVSMDMRCHPVMISLTDWELSGPYSCVGRSLGLIEIRLILANLVHRFDLSLAQDADEFEKSGKDHFGLAFEKLDLKVTERENWPDF